MHLLSGRPLMVSTMYETMLIFCASNLFQSLYLTTIMSRNVTFHLNPNTTNQPTAITFECELIKLSYFTCVFRLVRPFLQYQGEGHLSRSRSNITVTVFKEMADVGVILVSLTHLDFSYISSKACSGCLCLFFFLFQNFTIK